MQLDINYRNLKSELHTTTRQALSEMVERHLEPHVATFNSAQLRLHATLEKDKRDYQVTLRMLLPPRKMLVAKANNENLRQGISHAIKELARQAERHQSQISGREQWKRKKSLEQLSALKTQLAALPEEKRKSAEEKIEPLLSRIERFIKHELAYLRANGDLLPGYPTLEDIRDEALIRLKFDWDDLDSQDEALYQELLKAVYERFQVEIKATQLHANEESLEGAIPKDAMDQSEETVGEEIMSFYQPDEALHIEDLLPDTKEASVEDQIDQGQRQQCNMVLATLPSQWRTIMVLAYQENIPLDDVARNIMSISVDQAQQLLKQAESFMLDSLNQRGIKLTGHEDLIKLMAL